jgi:hypothetical protein
MSSSFRLSPPEDLVAAGERALLETLERPAIKVLHRELRLCESVIIEELRHPMNTNGYGYPYGEIPIAESVHAAIVCRRAAMFARAFNEYLLRNIHPFSAVWLIRHRNSERTLQKLFDVGLYPNGYAHIDLNFCRVAGASMFGLAYTDWIRYTSVWLPIHHENLLPPVRLLLHEISRHFIVLAGDICRWAQKVAEEGAQQEPTAKSAELSRSGHRRLKELFEQCESEQDGLTVPALLLSALEEMSEARMETESGGVQSRLGMARYYSRLAFWEMQRSEDYERPWAYTALWIRMYLERMSQPRHAMLSMLQRIEETDSTPIDTTP